MSESDVARIRRQIQAEYEAAKQGLSGFASGTARHDFINARTENIEKHHETLVELLGPEQAISLIANTIWSVTDQGTIAYDEEGFMTYINDINSAGEWVRLDHQAKLVGKATGLLPSFLENVTFNTLLDIGCGPGRWALDIAADRPEAMVTGIDLSRDLVAYANARARTQQLDNISFRVQDALSNKLPFAESSFDLIHLRFAVGWLKEGTWQVLLSRCFTLLKPSGYIVIIEGEGIYTTSMALERLQEILCQALFTRGYGLSHSPRFLGVVAHLGYFLHETGFRSIRTETTLLDYSYYHEDQEANRAWRESFYALINESSIFLIQSGVTTAEELAQLDVQISIEMFQENFCGLGPLFTFSAQKPRGDGTDEY